MGPGDVIAPDPARRWTYSSARTRLGDRVTEAYYLLAARLGGAEGLARATIDDWNATRERVRRELDVELKGLRMLDIGPGQQLRHMRCFSIDNEVEGIDMDVIPQALRLPDYLEMARRNSAARVAKTIVRKALGVDRRFLEALGDALGVHRFPPLTVRRMDASRMAFPDGSFGCVYSYSTFEHVDRPEEALAEVKRVLAPGGVMYVSIHLYSSHCGQHDPKMLLQSQPEPPFWPHLRPAWAHTVVPSTYLNEVRLPDWQAMFERVFPGVRFAYDRQDATLAGPLSELRAGGELAGWTDDELLTLNLVALWRKPGHGSAA